MNSINIIVNSDDKKDKSDNKDELPTKMDKLLELVSDKTKRFMVFSEFDGGLNKIEKLFDDNEIRYSGIKGTSNTISRIIGEFKERKFNVLLLNAKYFGAGLNLQFTDEIVIFKIVNFRKTGYEELNVWKTLKIISLLSNEYK